MNLQRYCKDRTVLVKPAAGDGDDSRIEGDQVRCDCDTTIDWNRIEGLPKGIGNRGCGSRITELF